MNKVILMGRLTKDPEVRYSQGENAMAVARYTLAVERRFKRDGEATADFISCIAFGKLAENAEKYFRQGLRVCISGHIQTGSYTNKDGNKIFTTDVVVEEQEFAQSKSEGGTSQPAAATQNNTASGNNPSPQRQTAPQTTMNDGFMNIPDGLDMELPFN